MAKAGRPKLTLKEIKEQHGLEVDISDPQGRSRYRRMLDLSYAAGLKLEEKEISDIARGSAIKAAIDYMDRTGGKAITPVDVTSTVTYLTPEQHAERILESLQQKDAPTITENKSQRVN